MAAVRNLKANLWFDSNAEEAADFYTQIFKDSSIGRKTFFGKEGFEIHGMKEGTLMTIEFTLNGMEIIALNGGPVFKFSEAVSFVVLVDSQDELDYYWDNLKEGGDESAQQCGWLKDKFGLSWQVVPAFLNDYLSDPDKEKSNRVLKAMLQMKKLDFGQLQTAYSGSLNQ